MRPMEMRSVVGAAAALAVLCVLLLSRGGQDKMTTAPSSSAAFFANKFSGLLKVGEPIFLVDTTMGFKMAIDPVVGHAGLVTTGHIGVEPWFALALNAIGPGQGVVQCGAHWGTLSLIAMAGGHRAWMYEPRPDNARLAQLAIVANDFEELSTFYQAAVWHLDSHLFLEYAAAEQKKFADTLDSTVVSSPDATPAGRVAESVAVVTLDRTLPADADIGLIVIDVAGADCNALEGAYRTLRKPSVKLVTVKFTPRNIRTRGGREPLRLLQILDASGFEVYEAERKRSAKEAEVGMGIDNLRRALGGDTSRRIMPDQFVAFVNEYDDESAANGEKKPPVRWVYGQLIAVRRAPAEKQ